MENSKKLILIAEDDDSIIEIMKIILEEEGYLVRKAKEKKSVTAEITKHIPDLIFLDIRLGGDNGEDIARDLRQSERTSAVPLVILSADSEIQTVSEKVGASGFLTKPFDIDSLIATVKKHLR